MRFCELLNGPRQGAHLLLKSLLHLRLLHPDVLQKFGLLCLRLQHFLGVTVAAAAARCCHAGSRSGSDSWIELARLVVHLFERGDACL